MSASVWNRAFFFWRTPRSFPARAAAGTPDSSGWLGRVVARPHVPPVASCLIVFILTFLLWRAGQFQFLELQAYDRFLKNYAPTTDDNSPIVVVGFTEEDIHRLDTASVPDDLLSDALQNLINAHPAAIVVDFYRDSPVVGKDPEGRRRLAALFAENTNLIAIQRLPLGRETGIRAPPFLSPESGQLGFNDFSILDQKVDDTVRRVTLMMWQFGEVYYSDPLLAALLYFETHDIPYNLNEANSNYLRLGKTTLRPFQANDGPYVDADARGYQVLLNFRGPAEFRTYEFADALAGKFPSEAVRGKVVFIGPLAPSLKDYLSTPLSKRFPGLLLHAQIVDQLIKSAQTDRPQIRFWPEWQETLWLLAWCIFGTVAGSNARSPIVFASVFLGCLAVLSGAYLLAMFANLWLLLIAPAAAFTCAAALSTSQQAYLERRQRDVLMDLFSQHVSANIAADIWNHREQFMDGHSPKPQVIHGTVFFTDLKGFTGHAESMPPEALISWLNEYMEVMAGLIEQHSGMVIKYMGDAIMAAFGAPIPRTTDEEIRRDAVNAARCALVMAQQLDRLNADWKKRGLPTTSMRVGIASGPLVSGSIGGSKRLEYTVTGDIVVIAKRLESAEKDSTHLEMASSSCRILISEETFAMVGPHFKTRPVGPMRLEGKNRSVGVYVLIGEAES